MALLGNEDYLTALEVALSHRKEYAQPAPGCWGSIELLFSAEQVCPMPLVVRSVAKLLGPTIHAIGLQEALRPPRLATGSGETVLSSLVSLVLGCAFESHQAQAGMHKLNSHNNTIDKLRQDLKEALQSLDSERMAASEAQRFHLEKTEQMLVQLDSSHHHLQRERAHVTSLYRELDELKDDNTSLKRQMQQLESTVGRLRALRDEQLLDEVAKGRVLQNRMETGDEELSQLRQTVWRQRLELEGIQEKVLIFHLEQVRRADVLHEFVAESVQLSLTAPVLAMRKAVQTMRIQLSLVDHQSPEKMK